MAAVQAFLVLLEKIEAFGISPDGLKNLTATFSELAKVSGLAKNELNDFLTNTRVLDGLTVDLDEATSALSISVGDLTASFQKQVGEALRFKAGFRDIAVAAALASDKQNDFDAGIKSGALNAERAAQAVGAIR